MPGCGGSPCCDVSRPGPATRTASTPTWRPLTRTETPGRGEVLRFPADELEIFPDDSNASTTSAPIPCGRTSGHGTLIKLYDYLPRLPKQGVCVTTKFSLLRHLEVCLLDLALPAKVYDCRAPSAHKTHPTQQRCDVRTR